MNITAGLLLSAVLVAFPGPSAWSQERNQEIQEIEEVVVTGTLTRGARQFESLVPMQMVDQADIQRIGASQVWDVLKTLTVNSGSNTINESGSFAGTAQFNIRGLGMSSTLTLLNGRRAGISTGDDGSGNAFTDINQFPIGMIKRIDVLADGASATYGSDAVGGVVNIITRKGFEGFERSTDYRDSQMDSYSLSLVTGKQFDEGGFNLYATYYRQDDRDRLDWDWMDKRLNGDGDLGFAQFTSGTGAPGTYFLADGGSVGFADPDCEAAGGVFRKQLDETGNVVVDTGTCRNHFGNNNSLGSEDHRLQVFAEFDYDLADNVKYYNEAHFSHNETFRTHGAPGWGAGRIPVPGDHPFNFFTEDPDNTGELLYIGPDAWNPAVHTGVDILAQARPLDARYNAGGSRGPLDRQRRVFDNYRMMNGLEFELANDWRANLTYTYSGANTVLESTSDFRQDIFLDLVADGEWNIFGTWIADPTLVSPKDPTAVADNPDELVQLIVSTKSTTAKTDQKVLEAIVTGDLFELGGRPVVSAWGAQWRSLLEFQAPDSLVAAGEHAGSCCAFETQGDQEVWALFGELVIPVGEWADVQLALRHEEYDGHIGSTTDPKLSIALHPADWLSFRGSYGSSFQAPTLRQTSDNRSSQTLNDEVILVGNELQCGGPPDGDQATVINQGADLDPQSATNFNFGVVLRPARSTNASVDYWNYDYEDLITQAQNAQSIIDDDCADDGIPNDPRIVRDGGGRLVSITTSFVNVGKVEADGFDFALLHSLDLGNNLGSIDFNGKATYVRKFDIHDGDTVIDGAGSRNHGNGFHSMPQWRWNAGATWRRGNHSFNTTVRYIDSYKNDQSNDAEIKSFLTADLQYSIVLNNLIGDGETVLAIGANNLFDEDPPGLRKADENGNIITQQDNPLTWIDRPGYDQWAGHDLRGRILYVNARYTF